MLTEIKRKNMTVSEMMLYLGISRSFAYKLIKCNGFPVIAISSMGATKKLIRINKDKLDQWLASQGEDYQKGVI